MKAVLDANLLLVLLVGLCDSSQLGRKNFVKEYLEDDFDILCEVIGEYETLYVTPNIVTECSNLLCGRDGHGKNEPESLLLGKLLGDGTLVGLEEEYVASFDAIARQEYRYLGVADCSLLQLVDRDRVIVTADGSLARAAQAINPLSVNFNHARTRSLLSGERRQR